MAGAEEYDRAISATTTLLGPDHSETEALRAERDELVEAETVSRGSPG
jgi:hypothetical protein